MYKVSREYSEQIKKPLRALSYIKIKFGLVSPDAVGDAEITSTSPKLPFAESPELVDDKEVTTLYSTLEPNFWLLDGSMDILPDSGDTKYQAYISDSMSSIDTAEYEGGVAITLEFDKNVYAFRGLTFTFDTVQNNYPTEVTVVGYLNGVQNYTYTSSIDSPQFVLEHNIPASGDFINKLDIIFTKNKLPGRRLRVQNIILGVLKILTPENIIESTWTRKNDLMNTVLPTSDFSFSFYDLKNEYNPDNPEGVWEFLETGQSVEFSYGYELESGDIEWIPGSTLYTQGTPSVKNGGSLPEVTFSATSRLQLLTDIYDEGIYYPSGISLYDLADMLLMWSGVIDTMGNKLYVLHNSLKNYLFTGVVPKMEVKQLLQLIANAGMCVLIVDRRGYIVFQPRATISSGFKYELDDILNATPDIKKYPYLKNLYAPVSTYSVSSEIEEVASIDVSDADNTEYTIEFSSATALSISVVGDLVINNTVGLYAQKAVLILTGTGTLKIQGKNISSATYTVLKSCNIVGEDCTLENPLITSREHATKYLDWMSEVLQMRSVYTFSDRGFPEVDESDIVLLDTHFTSDKQGVITGSTIKYNGALSGSTEVLS